MTRTTTTTTKRMLNTSNIGGYNETTNQSVLRGIRPYDQVDLVIEPEGSFTSSSKLLTTNVGLDRTHSPYFVISLRDTSVREGESVLFEVIVSGKRFARYFFLLLLIQYRAHFSS